MYIGSLEILITLHFILKMSNNLLGEPSRNQTMSNVKTLNYSVAMKSAVHGAEWWQELTLFGHLLPENINTPCLCT